MSQMSAAEHFEWSRQRAMEYVNVGDGGGAMSSLIQDLSLHPGTADILTSDLQMLFVGEVLVGGAGTLHATLAQAAATIDAGTVHVPTAHQAWKAALGEGSDR